MQSIANYLLVCHIFFLGYDESQKGYHCFDSISHKLYVSHPVFFFEHILIFFIPIESHNVFKSKLVHIDILLDDINSFHIDIDTLVPDHHAHFSPHMATLAPFKSMDPLPLHSFQRLHKSTSLPYFIHSSYSNSFTSFLASIHNHFEPLSYKEVILDLFW